MIVGMLVFALVGVTFVALAMSGRHPRAGGPVRRLTVWILAPAQSGVTAVIRNVGGVWEHYFDAVRRAGERDEMERALMEARKRENRFREMALENARLRELLDFKQAAELPVLAAEVVGKDPSPWFKSFLVNRGEGDGIRVGMPVVVAEGVVGQIVEVARSHAKVMLITDRLSGVDVLVQRTRARGVVNGVGEGWCELDYALREQEMREGDVVVTSGLDGVYPKGLRIGTVTSARKRDAGIFQEVRVVPLVDFERIEEVLIVRKDSGVRP